MRLALAVGWVAFVVFLAFASPAHYWLDSGEIGAAGFELGVMHPPGAPGYALLLRAATTVPLGSIGFRMAALSSLLAGVTVGGLVGLLRARGVHPLIAVGAAAWLAAGWTFARQARVVEIYALQGALMVVVLWGFLPLREEEVGTRRRLIGTMAAVWSAWCFGDARLALVVPVVVGWALALRRRRPWARWAPLCVLAASAVVLAVPLASARAPVTDWGDPDTLGALWDHLMASSIRAAYTEQIWPSTAAVWRLNVEAVLAGLSEDLGPVGPTLGLCAVVGLAWRPEPAASDQRVAALLAWLVAVELLYAVAINPMGVAERQTGLVLALLLAVAVAELARRHVQPRGRAVWAVVPLLFVVLALPGALRTAEDLENTASWGPAAWTRGALGQAPPGTLVLSQSDDLAAGLVFAQVVEGARPDVVAVPAQHLYKPVPDALLPGSAGHAVWSAAQSGTNEAERIVAAMTAHHAPVAVEAPTVSIFGGVGWWSDRGVLPVRVAGRTPAQQAALPEAPSPAGILVAWDARLPAAEDRRRLAWAMANDARGRIRVTQDARGALKILEVVTAQVSDREPGPWVALGSLQDRFGDRQGAIESTRRALALQPGRAAALENLALYLARDRATLREAEDVARRAVALRPERAKGWIRLSAILEAKGDATGAADARERANGLQ
ncbi:MAG: protein O-mannosyl-transferase family [Nannocystaceae bacterium]|nr:DUF2723 domain-containing protein [bacterium]